MSENLNKKVITEPEIGSNSVEPSNARPAKGASAPDAELKLALESDEHTIAALKAELAAAKAKSTQGSDSSIKELASLLKDLIVSKPVASGPTEVDNINRVSDFKNQKATVDGRSLMDAQQVLVQFRNENKKPISIPRSFATTVGPALSVTVNGVRVSIPCDGKTYYINETHWEHARERIAKIDALNSNTEPDIIEVG